MSHRPINLAEFSLKDIFYPWDPDSKKLTTAERDASSRILSCPSLIRYLLEETLNGRSRLIVGKSEHAHDVSNLAIEAFESHVLILGGQSFKEDRQPIKSMVGARSYMVLGNNIVRYTPLVGGDSEAKYTRGIASATDLSPSETTALESAKSFKDVSEIYDLAFRQYVDLDIQETVHRLVVV